MFANHNQGFVNVMLATAENAEALNFRVEGDYAWRFTFPTVTVVATKDRDGSFVIRSMRWNKD